MLGFVPQPNLPCYLVRFLGGEEGVSLLIYPVLQSLSLSKNESMSTPKKQHFVPAVYLRRFCNAEGRIHTYDIEKKELRSSKPENVAIKKHIYTIIRNGNKDVSIEEYLSEIETKYAEIVRKIEEDRFKQLDDNDLSTIIWFISFLYARNLANVNRFSEISKEWLSFIENTMSDYTLRQESEDHLRPFLQINTKPDYVQKMTMQTMFEVAQEMYKLLVNEGDWFFYKSQASSEFITTDNPMGNTVRFPLSKHILFMRVTAKVEGLSNRENVLSISSEAVNQINREIASTARRFLYGSNSELLKSYK